MSDNLDTSDPVDITTDSTTVQPYDSVMDTKVSGLSGSMLGGRRRRRTRGKRHTLKKAHKVKSRKLKSRRAKRRRGKRSRRRRHRGGNKSCTSGTSSFAVAGNTLGASESMLANPPSASLN